MYSEVQLAEYLDDIRLEVCSRCIERPAGGPPCGPLGKRCGVEVNLARLIEAVHTAKSREIDPYVESLDRDVCAVCRNNSSDDCPCPLGYLQMLAVQAVENVDDRRSWNAMNAC